MSDKVAARTRDLRVGTQLTHSIHDSKNVLLLAAGSSITDATIKQLLRLGVEEILIDVADQKSVPLVNRNSQTAETPVVPDAPPTPAEIEVRVEELLDRVSLLVSNNGNSLQERMIRHGCKPFDVAAGQRIDRRFETSVAMIDGLAMDLIKGVEKDAVELASIATGYLVELESDSDQVISSTINRSVKSAISERAIRLSLLGMAIAIEMDYDVENVRDVGICGLVQDLGLFTLPEPLQCPSQPFGHDDWALYADHTSATIGLLELVRGLSDNIRLAAYQSHETVDGSGYPRGLKYHEIHPFARILAVVDTYLSLTSQIRGRPAIVPHDVIAFLIHQVNACRCDGGVVRALLHILTLFPLGSHIELTDGGLAVVTRRNEANYSKPIVQRIDAIPGENFLDLDATGLSVKRPVPRPKLREMRLERDDMAELALEYWPPRR